MKNGIEWDRKNRIEQNGIDGERLRMSVIETRWMKAVCGGDLVKSARG